MTRQELKKFLSYNPRTGIWKWKKSNRTAHIKKGDIAGYLRNGYRVIKFHRGTYRASRLAYFYMMGKWPIKDMDHKNRNPSDDSWNNLRQATRSQNGANSNTRSSTGVKGVYKHKNKFRIMIGHQRKLVHIGLYDTIEKAKIVAKREHKKIYGEFSR